MKTESELFAYLDALRRLFDTERVGAVYTHVGQNPKEYYELVEPESEVVRLGLQSLTSIATLQGKIIDKIDHKLGEVPKMDGVISRAQEGRIKAKLTTENWYKPAVVWFLGACFWETPKKRDSAASQAKTRVEGVVKYETVLEGIYDVAISILPRTYETLPVAVHMPERKMVLAQMQTDLSSFGRVLNVAVRLREEEKR